MALFHGRRGRWRNKPGHAAVFVPNNALISLVKLPHPEIPSVSRGPKVLVEVRERLRQTGRFSQSRYDGTSWNRRLAANLSRPCEDEIVKRAEIAIQSAVLDCSWNKNSTKRL